MNYPRRTPYVHIEAIGEELCVYDWQRRRVHALNPTAALVWQRCDGATPLETIAEAVQLCLGAADSRALVSATLRELANADLLVESGEVAGPDATRRALLQRGIAAALLPVVHSIVAPEPLAAQSLGAPTLTGIAPGIGARSVTVRVTLTGTNFAVGNTTVAVSGSGVTVANVNVVSPTSLTADFAISGAAVVGARLFTIATPAGSADGVFTVVPFVTTFSFIPGGPQSFTVPAGVTSLTIAASGGEGGPADGARGGLGGSITATIDVTPGEALAIFVGGAGVRGTNVKTVQGGFNGGGLGPPDRPERRREWRRCIGRPARHRGTGGSDDCCGGRRRRRLDRHGRRGCGRCRWRHRGREWRQFGGSDRRRRRDAIRGRRRRHGPDRW